MIRVIKNKAALAIWPHILLLIKIIITIIIMIIPIINYCNYFYLQYYFLLVIITIIVLIIVIVIIVNNNNYQIYHYHSLLLLVVIIPSPICLSDIIILIFVGFIGGIFTLAACRVQRQSKSKQINVLGTLTEAKLGTRYSDRNNDEVPLVNDTSEDEFDVP